MNAKRCGTRTLQEIRGYLGKDEVKIVARGQFYAAGKSISLNQFAERAARGYCPGHRERKEST